MLTSGPAIDTEWACEARGDTPLDALRNLADNSKMQDERMQRQLAAGRATLEIRIR